MLGVIGTCGDGAGVPAAGGVLVPEPKLCDTPTTSQALKATSARAHAAKLKPTRPRRELNVLFNTPYFRRPAPHFSEARMNFRCQVGRSIEMADDGEPGRAMPATPLSQACSLETGGFASPPYGGFALAPTETQANIRPERGINSRLRHIAQHVAGGRHRAAARCRRLVTRVFPLLAGAWQVDSRRGGRDLTSSGCRK